MNNFDFDNQWHEDYLRKKISLSQAMQVIDEPNDNKYIINITKPNKNGYVCILDHEKVDVSKLNNSKLIVGVINEEKEFTFDKDEILHVKQIDYFFEDVQFI
ncbi:MULTISPECIES: hypothetical protein [Aliivibrio]|uniref:hypothetical protein n=1 Tax=Aliivibrio TaxID=511678 RepID=UPI00080EE4BF|nr:MULTISPECIES: hypothetical protein [Aliivibrio]MBD1569321.1 hypothetical protein [Aliivibrio sp. S10_S31]MUJ23918.1 hypothetical protein [Aliivibrio fischeri]OCH09452.1 hypothetical protein A6E09_14920 [Aliivibrio fischeri]